MDLLQELEVWYVIPTIRKELALAMKNKGLKQVEIAKRLDLTKSAITQYLNESRGNEIKLTPELREQVSISANRIQSSQDTIREIQYLIGLSREQKVACQLHKVLDKTFSNCNLCFEQPLITIGAKK